MAIKLFGFTIGRDDSDKVLTSQHFTVPEPEEGIAPIASGAGAYGTFLDLEGTVKNEFDLIGRYRGMSLQPECETAIDDIINEIIVDTGRSDLITLNLTNLNIGEKVKDQIRGEFKHTLRMMDFRNLGTISLSDGTLTGDSIIIWLLIQRILARASQRCVYLMLSKLKRFERLRSHLLKSRRE